MVNLIYKQEDGGLDFVLLLIVNLPYKALYVVYDDFVRESALYGRSTSTGVRFEILGLRHVIKWVSSDSIGW